MVHVWVTFGRQAYRTVKRIFCHQKEKAAFIYIVYPIDEIASSCASVKEVLHRTIELFREELCQRVSFIADCVHLQSSNNFPVWQMFYNDLQYLFIYLSAQCTTWVEEREREKSSGMKALSIILSFLSCVCVCNISIHRGMIIIPRYSLPTTTGNGVQGYGVPRK